MTFLSQPIRTTMAALAVLSLMAMAACGSDKSPGTPAGDAGDASNPTPDVGVDAGAADASVDAVDVQEGDDADTDGTTADVPDGEVSGCDETFVGTTCGATGCGIYECIADALVCVGDSANPCGGCAELPGLPGADCTEGGVDGVWQCDASDPDGDSVTCVASSTCPCGGAECDLTATYPGTPCGECLDGRWTCDSGTTVECVGASARNACGGCGELPGAEGDSCGACDAGQWACDGTELICVGDSVEGNACGGCGPIVGTPGDPCDDGCGAGTLTCSADGEALFCVGPTTGNPCGGCGELTGGGQPGAACSTCGVWECVDPFTTECTNPRGTNACGGCELLEGWPGDGCGCGGRGTCCLLYTSPSPRDRTRSRMPSSA